MSLEEDNTDIYLTSPSDLEKYRKSKSNDNKVSDDVVVEYEAYHFDGPRLVYKEYSLSAMAPGESIETKNEEDCPIRKDNRSDEECLDTEDISSGPSEHVMKDEYLLSRPPKKEDPNESQFETPEQRPKKGVVQDIYDEDNYCLARTSGLSAQDDTQTVIENHSGNARNISVCKKATFSCTKNKIIVGLIVGVLTQSVIFGLLFFLTSNNLGKL